MSKHFEDLIDNQHLYSITESSCGIEILEMLVNFVYKFEIPAGLNFIQYASLYTLAKKYGIKELMEQSWDRLSDEVTIDTACSCIIEAYSITDVTLNLKRAIFKYIMQNYEEVSATPSFLNLCDHNNVVKDLMQFMYEIIIELKRRASRNTL